MYFRIISAEVISRENDHELQFGRRLVALFQDSYIPIRDSK